MNPVIWRLYNRHKGAPAAAMAAVFGLTLALVLYWTISASFMLSQTQALRASLKTKTAALAVKRNSIQRPVETKPGSSLGVGYQVVDRLHAALVSYCDGGDASKTCVVTQFTSATTPGPYITHYGISGANFGAFHVHVTLLGNLARILAALHQLADCDVPFEYSSISITPIDATNPSQPNVASVSLEMDVLSKNTPTAQPGGPT